MSTQGPHEEFNLDGTTVIDRDITKEMENSYMDYSMSVIVGRALPDVRDGLKPVHRRILYKMYEMNLTPSRPYRKCADIVGNVLGSYHPHGDASVYDALVRLAQDFSMRYPLVDGHGNFGSVDGDPPAAYRYTEARMAKASLPLLEDIEEDTVDTKPNYDDRLQEPVVLPVRFPSLLVNGSSGIAVGMATNIPPHNMGECIDAVCYLIDHPDAEIYDLMEFIKGPDFPTGGTIMGMSGIRSAYATGRGKITVRSEAEIQERKPGYYQIIVTELPYQVNKARLMENIAEHVNNKRIEGISNIRDESSNRVGMRMVIELKRDANPEIVLNKLYQMTQLQTTFGVIMLALEDGVRPRVMTLKQVLEQYIAFQEEIIVRRTRFRLKKAEERAHILEGLKIAQDSIDEVIEICRSSADQSEIKARLSERFGLDDLQASAIVAMRLGQLSHLDRQKIENELAELQAVIEELHGLLEDRDKRMTLIKEESIEIRDKYSDDRRTRIVSVSGEVDVEDLIPVEDCIVTLTHYGYVKRQPVDVYKSQKRGGKGISGMTRREEDFVEELFLSSSHDYIMFFTNMGRCYRIKCYEIAESSRTAKGINIVNILPLEENEKIEATICVPRDQVESEELFISMVTRKGIIKRTALETFKNIRKNGVRAIVLDEDDSLAFARLTTEEDEVVIATHGGLSIRFPMNNVRAMGRTTRGVKAITLREEDYVVGMAIPIEGCDLLTITEEGYGRRTAIEEYRLQSRGGKGSINYKVDEKRGAVAGMRRITDEDDVMMIADNGTIIRMAATDINSYSRYSRGVRVMRLAEDTQIVTFTSVPKEEEEEETIDVDVETTTENAANTEETEE